MLAELTEKLFYLYPLHKGTDGVKFTPRLTEKG